MNIDAYVLGKRVKYNDEWLVRFRNRGKRFVACKTKRGTITGLANIQDCLRVKWDTLSQVQTIAAKFLDTVEIED